MSSGTVRTFGSAKRPFLGSPERRILPAAIVTAVACAGLAAVMSGLGTSGAIVSLGILLLAFGMLLVREKPLFVFLLMLLSLQFLFHKSFGPIYPEQYSGAPSIFISNIGAFLIVLYALWVAEGSFLQDVRAALTRPEIYVPALGMMAVLPSIFAAEDIYLFGAELFRMGWILMLFVYVAMRLKTRREIWFVIGALFLVAVTQSAIAVVQWKTGSSLGLGFLGEESDLGVRPLLEGELIRPSGTVVHPDFLAALVGPISLWALSLGIELPRGRARWICLAIAPIALAPLVLALTRAALLGEAVAGALIVGTYLYRRRLRWTPVVAATGVLLGAVILTWQQIDEKIIGTIGSAQLENEIQSRLELNGIALAMVSDHPLIGVGLNNFALALGHYDVYGLLFAGNPVHNIYLVVLAETGIIGVLGMLATFVVFFRCAVRLARSSDRFFAAIGIAAVAAQVFFYVDGLLTFSLREEMPMALYWILAGVTVAACRIAPQASLVSDTETAGA